MIIRYSGWYSTALLSRFPNLTFVFGDNLLRFGKGGQAIIRDEPNAFGVPTKRKPAMTPGSFFKEGSEEDMDAVLATIGELWELLRGDHSVVIPVTENGEISLGLERAELKVRAPSIHRAITTHVEEMSNAHGVVEAATAEELQRHS